MDQVKLARKQPFFTLKLKNKNVKYLKKKKTCKISKRETHWRWQVRLPTEIEISNKLVESEKGPKFKNKSITWLSTAQDGANRKTALCIRQKGALRFG